MKPIYVILIAIASALTGGFVGSVLGGVTGGVAGAAGGGALGMKAGVCAASEVAQNQKLLSPAQTEQFMTQSYAKLNSLIGNKDLTFTSNPDCPDAFKQVKELAK